MGDLSILVWNCDGLNAPHKRSSVLSLFRQKKIDLALLQETNLLSKDSSRIANTFYHTIASSTASTKTKGVAIVCRRNLKIKVQDFWVDDAGRIVIAKVELYGKKVALISIYAPNTFNNCLYDILTKRMLDLTDYSFIVGADMNAVWDIIFDRSSSTASREQELATAALHSWAKSLGLIDIWRSCNPATKDYTFFSSRHKDIFKDRFSIFVS